MTEAKRKAIRLETWKLARDAYDSRCQMPEAERKRLLAEGVDYSGLTAFLRVKLYEG